MSEESEEALGMSPTAILLKETKKLVTKASMSKDVSLPLCKQVSLVVLSPDGPLPLLLCWIVLLVEYFSIYATFTINELSPENQQWMSSEVTDDRLRWHILQIFLLLIAIIINVSLHFRTNTTQFQARKR